MVMSLVSLTCPGTKTPLRDNASIKRVVGLLDTHHLQYQFVDNVAGWGCLNQDWLEFTCEIETSWGWCKPQFLTEAEWTEIWFPLLQEGKVLMQVYYKVGDELVAHH